MKDSSHSLWSAVNTMSPKDLPYDVVIDILSRLPVKTLIRYRCVCKSWYASITDSSFIITHLNRTCSSYDTYLQYMNLEPSGERKLCLLSEQTEFEIPFHSQSSLFVAVGTVNGLLCLTDCAYKHFGRILFLWNPSIRKSKALSYSNNPLLNYYPNNSVVIGFGFCSQTNDYKVVRIIHFMDNNRKYIEEATPQVEVYTLSTDSWKTIDATVPCFLNHQVSTAFLNGSVHWYSSTSIDMILSFHIGDEVFREMMLPNFNNIAGVGLGGLDFFVTVLKESLFLCVYNHWNRHCDIWVMKEYGVFESWTKQFTILVPEARVQRCLGFTKKNEFLLQLNCTELVSYDLKSLQPNYLGNHRSTFTIHLLPFKETLVLLDGYNALLGQAN